MIKSFFRWLLLSSADPTRLSSTIKGSLLGIIPAIIWLSGFTHIQFDSAGFTMFVDSIAVAVQYALSFISAAWAAYGIGRKLWLTWKGTNHMDPTV